MLAVCNGYSYNHFMCCVILQVETEMERSKKRLAVLLDSVLPPARHEDRAKMRYAFDLKALRSFHSIREGKVKADGVTCSQGQR